MTALIKAPVLKTLDVQWNDETKDFDEIKIKIEFVVRDGTLMCEDERAINVEARQDGDPMEIYIDGIHNVLYNWMEKKGYEYEWETSDCISIVKG
jgi:hypothetical protein